MLQEYTQRVVSQTTSYSETVYLIRMPQVRVIICPLTCRLSLRQRWTIETGLMWIYSISVEETAAAVLHMVTAMTLRERLYLMLLRECTRVDS